MNKLLKAFLSIVILSLPILAASSDRVSRHEGADPATHKNWVAYSKSNSFSHGNVLCEWHPRLGFSCSMSYLSPQGDIREESIDLDDEAMYLYNELELEYQRQQKLEKRDEL